MATLKHKNTGHTVTTSYAPEIVSLRAQGYTDVQAEKPAEIPAGLAVVVNDTGRAEVIMPAPKSKK